MNLIESILVGMFVTIIPTLFVYGVWTVHKMAESDTKVQEGKRE